jgi:hypothetical protein
VNLHSLGALIASAALVLTAAGCSSSEGEEPLAPTSPPTTVPSSPTTSAPGGSPTASTSPTPVPSADEPTPAGTSPATHSPRPTPTTTEITDDMGPGEHDSDGY